MVSRLRLTCSWRSTIGLLVCWWAVGQLAGWRVDGGPKNDVSSKSRAADLFSLKSKWLRHQVMWYITAPTMYQVVPNFAWEEVCEFKWLPSLPEKNICEFKWFPHLHWNLYFFFLFPTDDIDSFIHVYYILFKLFDNYLLIVFVHYVYPRLLLIAQTIWQLLVNSICPIKPQRRNKYKLALEIKRSVTQCIQKYASRTPPPAWRYFSWSTHPSMKNT